MVTGHNVAGAFGIILSPEGSLCQQLFDSEVINVQLSASMGVFHTVAPWINAFERSLDLSYQNRNPISRSASENTLIPNLVALGAGNAGVVESLILNLEKKNH
jgi:hypothetical protein